jgi:hypothetical protein
VKIRAAKQRYPTPPVYFCFPQKACRLFQAHKQNLTACEAHHRGCLILHPFFAFSYLSRVASCYNPIEIVPGRRVFSTSSQEPRKASTFEEKHQWPSQMSAQKL